MKKSERELVNVIKQIHPASHSLFRSYLAVNVCSALAARGPKKLNCCCWSISMVLGALARWYLRSAAYQGRSWPAKLLLMPVRTRTQSTAHLPGFLICVRSVRCNVPKIQWELHTHKTNSIQLSIELKQLRWGGSGSGGTATAVKSTWHYAHKSHHLNT